jgi:hypothetical protein
MSVELTDERGGGSEGGAKSYNREASLVLYKSYRIWMRIRNLTLVRTLQLRLSQLFNEG